MKQVPNRQKLRRKYLRNKIAGYFGMTAATAGLLLALGGTILFGGLAILVLKCIYDAPFDLGIILALSMGLGAGACLGLGIYGYRAAMLAKQRLVSLPYVPPVTPDTLPAEEILVRGSEEPPVTQNEVLLRAAQTGQETAKEELLRVSQE